MEQPMMPYTREYFEEGDGYARGKNRRAKLVRAVMQFNPKLVLDVGCGQGYLLSYLFKKYHMDCVGIDISDEGIKDSKYLGKHYRCKFIKHDATVNLPFYERMFDVVISSDFFEHVPEERIDFVYSEMKRVGKNIIALISFKHEKRKTGIDTHLTVKPRKWWVKKLPGCYII